MDMRLDRFLAETGHGTRSEAKQALKRGRVQVNGSVVKAPETRIDPEADVVALDDAVIAYAAYEYYMVNKPAGVVTATEDRRQRTVMELLQGCHRKDLFPVGRLDKDTEGLLLVTNDGALAHRLLHPSKHVDKIYYVRMRGELAPGAEEAFRNGLDIGDDKPTEPALLRILSSGPSDRAPDGPPNGSPDSLPDESSDRSPDGLSEIEAEITIHEGRFHQVKRMAQAVGCEVVYLKRLSMGPLRLDMSLKPGEYRALTVGERQVLFD